ncbi:EthD family reductase [Ktedonobacter racemifer]|uniref:Ethyl tert-butyl ether degradation EthD n=2 Tax=Ktedonobacter racemifer TaxID=363277 RepID=D6U460_KTERA|nr:EthD family reductase [Ktedonobacter racemifer]EFH81290.1 Ethyl tert-butyl ether degradation EthD [Ktedonobacter racemifer DSM 44963]EFH81295.1 Ethyl tert-butyl ether degradation EthD [Ktedonobacter racemifer DSM 44963]
MVKYIVLWNTPEDPVAFERHYRDVHIPLVKQMPGLRRYTIGPHVTALRGGEPYYWIAELEWDTMDALQKALQSPQGQATAQDAASLVRSTGTSFRTMAYEVEEV